MASRCAEGTRSYTGFKPNSVNRFKCSERELNVSQVAPPKRRRRRSTIRTISGGERNRSHSRGCNRNLRQRRKLCDQRAACHLRWPEAHRDNDARGAEQIIFARANSHPRPTHGGEPSLTSPSIYVTEARARARTSRAHNLLMFEPGRTTALVFRARGRSSILPYY